MQFYFLFNIVIFSRLFYGFKSEAVSIKRLCCIVLFQIIFLALFKISPQLIVLLSVIILINISDYFLERKIRNLNVSRLLTFLIYFILIAVVTSNECGLTFNEDVLTFIAGLNDYIYFLNKFNNVNWFAVNVMLAAVLYLLNESNYLIRYFFELFALTPLRNSADESVEIDTREYNAGRIIGMLERILIFLFLIENQYAAIGFILAAKGFTRFKELEDRRFAEYVLIGTFLSALSAIIVTLLIKSVLLSQ